MYRGDVAVFLHSAVDWNNVYTMNYLCRHGGGGGVCCTFWHSVFAQLGVIIECRIPLVTCFLRDFERWFVGTWHFKKIVAAIIVCYCLEANRLFSQSLYRNAVLLLLLLALVLADTLKVTKHQYTHVYYYYRIMSLKRINKVR